MPATAGQGVQSTQPVTQIASATPFVPSVKSSQLVITDDNTVTVNVPAPVATQDDFVKIELWAITAHAHVFAFGANKLNGNKTSATWTKGVAGKVGDIMAYQGVWYFTGAVADANAFAQQVTLA